MTIEHKVLPLTGTFGDNGSLSGHAAVFNNLDDGGDIIMPGFFAPALDDFMKSGFVAWGHDWQTPIAIPTKAEEDATGLAVEATFHSDAQSQRYRTIASERMAAGKTMGLSIGYSIAADGSEQTKAGRLLQKADRLFEFSLVTVPMNRLAQTGSVKSNEPYAEHAERVTAELRSLVDRSSEVARHRKEGRVLSSANRTRLESLTEQLAALQSDIRDLLASTDPEGGKAAHAAEIEYLLMQSRDLGLLN